MMQRGKLSTEGFVQGNVLLAIVLVVIVLVVVYILLRAKQENSRHAVESMIAEVIDKRQKGSGNGMIGKTSRNVSLGMSVSGYTVSFQNEAGDIWEFSTDRKEYEKLRIGDKGNLTYQNQKYISFEKYL